MRFLKYHGAGNDFVMLLDLAAELGPHSSLARDAVAAICDRHTGVGADGLIRAIGPAGDAETAGAGAAVRMDYYNADGGAAEMCGNGIRCLVVLAHRNGLLEPGDAAVMTLAGARAVRLDVDGASVAVDMGVPVAEQLQVRHRDAVLEGTGVSMGNPHLVLFCRDIGRNLGDELVHGLGAELEVHADFPNRTNVEFVDVVSTGEIVMRVWERGIGETLACGSGACAAGVASALLGRTKRRVDVRMPGGVLGIDWREDDHVWLTGPAQEVFTGEIDFP